MTAEVRKTSRRNLWPAGLLGAVLLMAACAFAAPRPNVLLILVDDLKPALGCYGDPVARTPNMDRLAARGMRFDLAYCNQAVCAPSRFTLMLGSHSTSTGLYGLGSQLRQVIPEAVTMPQHFAKHGYRTESLGKIFHIGHGNRGDPASFSVPHFHDKVIEYCDPASTDGGKLTREEAYFTNQKLGQIRSLPRGAAFESPDGREPVPLLVALHTWSAGYKQGYHKAIERWCVEKGWAYIHPHFRGPNVRPESTGSELVVKDIVSAVAYAKKEAAIDASSIYLVGTSGGGYTALLVAGRHPETWAGVSAWVPISDLRAWYAECRETGRKYHRNIAASCGGPPGSSPAVDAEYDKRSPLTYLENARGLQLHINAGIHDGHRGSVPISHSLRAFNKVADPKDRLSEDQITYFVEKADVPPTLKATVADESYGKKTPLFRRRSGDVTVTIFKGGHELVASAAIAWIEDCENRK